MNEIADFPPTPTEILFGQIYSEVMATMPKEEVDDTESYWHRKSLGMGQGRWKSGMSREFDGLIKRLNIGDTITANSYNEVKYMRDSAKRLGMTLSSRKGVLTRIA